MLLLGNSLEQKCTEGLIARALAYKTEGLRFTLCLCVESA